MGVGLITHDVPDRRPEAGPTRPLCSVRHVWLTPNCAGISQDRVPSSISCINLAVAVGFEPTVELPPHTLSRRAP